jgi:hypothetical protein
MRQHAQRHCLLQCIQITNLLHDVARIIVSSHVCCTNADLICSQTASIVDVQHPEQLLEVLWASIIVWIQLQLLHVRTSLRRR